VWYSQGSSSISDRHRKNYSKIGWMSKFLSTLFVNNSFWTRVVGKIINVSKYDNNQVNNILLQLDQKFHFLLNFLNSCSVYFLIILVQYITQSYIYACLNVKVTDVQIRPEKNYLNCTISKKHDLFPSKELLYCCAVY